MVQSATSHDCERSFPISEAKAVGLFGGTFTLGGIVGVSLEILGATVFVIAVRWAYRPSVEDE